MVFKTTEIPSKLKQLSKGGHKSEKLQSKLSVERNKTKPSSTTRLLLLLPGSAQAVIDTAETGNPELQSFLFE